MNNTDNHDEARNTLVPSRRSHLNAEQTEAVEVVNTNPVLHPNKYKHPLAKQLMETALHTHLHKDSLDSCIQHGIDSMGIDKRKASALVSMTYNTTLKLVADALDASLVDGYVEPDQEEHY